MSEFVDGRNIKVPIRSAATIASDAQPDGALVIENETGKLFTYGSDANGITGVDVSDAGLGWELYTDTDVVGSPQTLTASQDNVITIDTKSISTYSPSDVNDLWNTSTNKITPNKVGDCYIIRFSFKAEIANVSGYFTLAIDIGGSQGKIFQRVNTFPKGANIEHSFSTTNLIFTLGTFVANGGEIKINPSHTMQIYDKSLTLQRSFTGSEI